MRAGEYIENKEGILTFHPAALPPEPELDIDKDMLSLLTREQPVRVLFF